MAQFNPNQVRSDDLSAVTKRNGWRLMQDTTMKMLDGSSLYKLALTGRSYRNFIIGGDWEYAEVSFKLYYQRMMRPYAGERVTYAIMAVKLPRRLPNIVFDSLKYERRQYKELFDKRLLHRLEGGFNKHFATYFALDYVIDDMSFITPEVMLAMIEADEYDIEIIHDTLLLFGPITPDTEIQIKDMERQLHHIREKLLHNILTYRDERVPYKEGRLVVSRSGMFLKSLPLLGPWDWLLYLGTYFVMALAIIGFAVAVCFGLLLLIY